MGLVVALGLLFLLTIFVTWTAWHVVDGLNDRKARQAQAQEPPSTT
jgi:hypothetical protein